MVALEEVSPWPPRISDGSTRWKLPRSCSKRIETSPADVHSRTGVATVGMPASYPLDAFGKLVPVGSRYSCDFPMVETEQPAKPFTALNGAL